MKFLLGHKQKMTQVFNDAGQALAATVVAAGPISVTQVRDEVGRDYRAVQVALVGDKQQTKRETRVKPDAVELEVGQVFDASVFAAGDMVTVSGISKGKGFQGVVKRHKFKGGPRTHGQKHSEREPGSIGGGLRTRVPKGMRMAGRMGGDRVTVKNLKVLHVDAAQNVLVIAGAIPGVPGSLLEIRGQ